MEILLTTLAAHRFLAKSGDRFALEALARNYLLESSPTYIGGMLDFAVATHSMCTVENLENCARSNRSLAYGRGEMFQEHAEQVARARDFTQAMLSQSIAPAMVWPKRLDLSNHKKMLDIAGGSGAHAIGALLHWPRLTATVYEMAPVSGFVSEYAKKYNLSDRLGSVTGTCGRTLSHPATCTSTRRSFTTGRLNNAVSRPRKASPRYHPGAGLSFTSFYSIPTKPARSFRLSCPW
jgi:hypothetical protein